MFLNFLDATHRISGLSAEFSEKTDVVFNLFNFKRCNMISVECVHLHEDIFTGDTITEQASTYTGNRLILPGNISHRICIHFSLDSTLHAII